MQEPARQEAIIINPGKENCGGDVSIKKIGLAENGTGPWLEMTCPDCPLLWYNLDYDGRK